MAVIDDLLNSTDKGRKLIIVDEEVTPRTVVDVIQKAWSTFSTNKKQIERLIQYYLGKQNQDFISGSTEDFYGKGIENKTTINYASSTVRTIVGYTYSQVLK